MVDWPVYLAPWIDDIVPGSAQDLMYVVGAVEILAGVIVALKPRYGAYVVAGWLAGIILNLLTCPATTTSPCATSAYARGADACRLASVYDPPATGQLGTRVRSPRTRLR